jgi:hypothetical protein
MAAEREFGESASNSHRVLRAVIQHRMRYRER